MVKKWAIVAAMLSACVVAYYVLERATSRQRERFRGSLSRMLIALNQSPAIIPATPPAEFGATNVGSELLFRIFGGEPASDADGDGHLELCDLDGVPLLFFCDMLPQDTIVCGPNMRWRVVRAPFLKDGSGYVSTVSGYYWDAMVDEIYRVRQP